MTAWPCGHGRRLMGLHQSAPVPSSPIWPLANSLKLYLRPARWAPDQPTKPRKCGSFSSQCHPHTSEPPSPVESVTDRREASRKRDELYRQGNKVTFGGLAQLSECLLRVHKALDSIPGTSQNQASRYTPASLTFVEEAEGSEGR